MTLFGDWLTKTGDLQQRVYGVDYDAFIDDQVLADYVQVQSFAAIAEVIEMADAVSWKPWQHDVYADRTELMKEAVDVLHFVANMLCAAGITTDALNAAYLAKMKRNEERQLEGYRVRDLGVKCRLCSRALDDVEPSTIDPNVCTKCEGELQ